MTSTQLNSGKDGRFSSNMKNYRTIPIINCSQPEDQAAYHRVLRALETAPQVTIICGAGISTSAGIPDFRSADGLYHQGLAPVRGEVMGSEIFDARILQDEKKLIAYGRIIAKLRTISRNARPTACHNYIAKLHGLGRLLRCYTQNIDGLQTRGRPHLNEVVLELHGNIQTLRCNRCSKIPDGNEQEIDEDLQRDGYAHCKKCQQRGKTGPSGRWELRSFSPGLLLPQVLHNDGSSEPESNGMTLDQLEQADGSASLLLVIGTSIRTDGTAKLVKSLAKKVHEGGGVVVYIDRAQLSDRKWGDIFDVQLQIELDKWALDALRHMSAEQNHVDINQEVMNAVNSLQNRSTQSPVMQHLSKNSVASSLGNNDPAPVSEAYFVPETNNWVILVCHSGAARLLAHAMAFQLVTLGEKCGLKCHAYVVMLSGSTDDLSSVPVLEDYWLTVVHISDYVFRLPSMWRPVETGQKIQDLLEKSADAMQSLSEQSNGQLLLMICAEDELLSRRDMVCLQESFERQSTFGSMIASLNLSQLKMRDWARFVVDLVSSHAHNRANLVSDSAMWWMHNAQLFNNSDLVVFSRATRPTMLLASLADRPMGKPLPIIGEVCACQPTGLATTRKQWEIDHDAVDGFAVKGMRMGARCSACGQSWALNTSNLIGTASSTQGVFCVRIEHDKDLGWI